MLLTNKNVSLIYSVTVFPTENRFVHLRGAFNINNSTVFLYLMFIVFHNQFPNYDLNLRI